MPTSRRAVQISVAFLIVLGLILVAISSKPNAPFASGDVLVEEGMTTAEIARVFDESGVVYSKSLLQILLVARGAERSVQAGLYSFAEPVSTWEASARLLHGEGLSQRQVRLQEGSTRAQMAEVLTLELPTFDAEEFLAATEGKEGYLFPDTYTFYLAATAEEVAEILEDTFYERVNTIEDLLIESGRSLEEAVIMASLIEREAYDPTDRRLISGVLWNRLEIGMALQVDAPFYFLLGKASSELTLNDLEIDSPFNTYLYPGLPPAPIASPSLDSIEAALDPTPSDYLFYLSDEDGVTHFAEDFEQHKANKQKYLR